MKKNIFNQIYDHILDFISIDEIQHYNAMWYTPSQLVNDWFFWVYYDQAFDELKQWYWDSFDATRYLNKDWHYKYKQWTPYVWTVYKSHLVYVMNKLLSK